MNPNEVFNQALALHQAGKFAEAEPLYRQILAHYPDHPATLHLLGVLFYQRRDFAQAIPLMERSVALEKNPVAFCNLSAALRDVGRPEEAIRAAKESLALATNYPEALNNLANATRDIGRRDRNESKLYEAAETYRLALAAEPNHFSAMHNLALTLRDLMLHNESIDTFQRLLAIKPDFAPAWSSLSLTLQNFGEGPGNRLAEALAAIDRAVALAPKEHDYHRNRGVVLEALDRLDEALAAYNVALSLKENSAGAIMNIGSAYQRQGRADEALAMLEKANALEPNNARTLRNLAVTLRDLRRIDESLETYRKSLELDPHDPYAHMLFGMALLLAGDFAHGWEEYEWRTRRLEFIKASQFPLNDWHSWNRRDLKSVLLYAEQGFGDVIQFIRYAKILADRGTQVFVLCQDQLLRLFDRSFPNITFVTTGDKLPKVDAFIPLMSLPFYFQTTRETIPAAVPYVSAVPEDVAAFRKIIPPGKRNIGLVWAGNPIHKSDHARSIPFELLAPLATVDAKFWSLQIGDRALSAATDFPIENLAPRISDFASTAAALECLDLLISVDTSMVHLAGALNRPVWTLLQYAPDWRWLERGNTSPWYPSMKLFRQEKRGDWETVVERVRAELGESVSR